MNRRNKARQHRTYRYPRRPTLAQPHRQRRRCPPQRARRRRHRRIPEEPARPRMASQRTQQQQQSQQQQPQQRRPHPLSRSRRQALPGPRQRSCRPRLLRPDLYRIQDNRKIRHTYTMLQRESLGKTSMEMEQLLHKEQLLLQQPNARLIPHRWCRCQCFHHPRPHRPTD